MAAVGGPMKTKECNENRPSGVRGRFSFCSASYSEMTEFTFSSRANCVDGHKRKRRKVFGRPCGGEVFLVRLPSYLYFLLLIVCL